MEDALYMVYATLRSKYKYLRIGRLEAMLLYMASIELVSTTSFSRFFLATVNFVSCSTSIAFLKEDSDIVEDEDDCWEEVEISVEFEHSIVELC